MKINWVVVTLIAVCLFLTWVLFRGCSTGNTHADEHKAVDSVNAYWQTRHAVDAKYVDSITREDHIKDSIIDELSIDVSLSRSNLKIADHRAAELVEIIQSHVDTPSKMQACDSLAVLVTQYSFQVGALSTLTDSLISQYTRKLEIKQDLLTRIQVSYTDQNKSLEDQTKKYDGLYKDYTKVVKANKFNKTLSRVLAGVVLVVGGAFLVK